MAIIFMDGFDLYSATVPVSRRWSGGGLVAGRFGGQALSTTTGNQSLTLGSFNSTLAVGFAWNRSSFQAKTLIFSFNNSLSGFQQTMCSISIEISGAVTWDGPSGSGATASSVPGLIATNTWHYYEVELTRSTTTGTIKVYLDGVQIISKTNVNTGTTDIDYLSLQGGNGNVGVSFDDMYCVNVATRLGECRIDTLRPTADTATKGWTPNSGTTNFSRVSEETSDGDTTFNSATVVGTKDLFAIADLPVTPTTIFAVQPVLVARKDNTALSQLCVDVVSGSATVQGAVNSLTSTYSYHVDTLVADPNTGAAWTATAVNALQLGYEILL